MNVEKTKQLYMRANFVHLYFGFSLISLLQYTFYRSKKLSHVCIIIFLYCLIWYLVHGVAEMIVCVADELQMHVIVFRCPNLVTVGVQCHVD